MNYLISLFVFIIFFMAGCSPSTETKAPAIEEKGAKTNIEQFIAKSGKVVVRSYKEIGKVVHTKKTTYKGYTFTDKHEISTEAIEVINPSTNERSLGLIIGIDDKDRSYIDYDEIDSLVSGIDYISKINKTMVSFPHFEAYYSTKSGLRITTFNYLEDKMSVSFTAISKKAYVDLEALKTFKELILKSKQVLSEVKK